MTDKEKDSIISKVARILGEEENRIKWNMSLESQIVALVEYFESLPSPPYLVIKEKNGVDTVIQIEDRRYCLQHPNQYKGGK